MSIPFHALVEALASAHLAALRAALEPPEARAARWATPGQLAWLGVVYEQEKLYLGCSHGARLDGTTGPQGFAWDETTRLDFLIGRAEFERVCDLAREVGELAPPPGADPDDGAWDEARHAFADLAVLAALAVVQHRLARDPSALPLPLAQGARLTVADDNESPTFPAHIPSVLVEGEAQRQALLAACPREEDRLLLEHLLRLGGPDAPELLAEVQRFLAARG